ncbi:MAG: hypothetical protein OEN52_04830 [Gammaproteobacteria bacterium]|nr:hypothetical protein [Gammaproteobacteria bacterium]MDH3560261.1 hypothetical protein [Gammaproteobacteria bacterium]
MKKLMLIVTLAFAAPFAWAESEMATDAAAAADTSAETAATAATKVVEVVDKGTPAAPRAQALSQVKTDDAAQ